MERFFPQTIIRCTSHQIHLLKHFSVLTNSKALEHISPISIQIYFIIKLCFIDNFFRLVFFIINLCFINNFFRPVYRLFLHMYESLAFELHFKHWPLKKSSHILEVQITWVCTSKTISYLPKIDLMLFLSKFPLLARFILIMIYVMYLSISLQLAYLKSWWLCKNAKMHAH